MRKLPVHKCVTLSVKPDLIKCFDRDERDEEILCAFNWAMSTSRTIYNLKERILKAVEVIDSVSC